MRGTPGISIGSWATGPTMPSSRRRSPRSWWARGPCAAPPRCAAYWEKGLAANPDLHFERRGVLVGHDSIVLSYINHRGQECAEVIVIGSDGLAHRGLAHYSPAP